MESADEKIMKKLQILALSVLLSCSGTIPKPENLIPEGEMSSIIADFAINDQMGLLNQQGDMQQQGLFILQQHRISQEQFLESHRYYLTKPWKLEKIYSDAQDIILSKDPEAKAYIEKKTKEETAPN